MSSVRGVVGVECANTKEFGYIDDPGRERGVGRIYRRRNLEDYVATHEGTRSGVGGSIEKRGVLVYSGNVY